MKENIVILGSGLAGSLLSILLAQQGYTVQVYEKRRDPRTAEAEGGRSINLALSQRGWRALEAAGLARTRTAAGYRYARAGDPPRGKLTFQAYGTAQQAIYSVDRSGLNQLLLQAAAQQGVNVFFQHACQSVDLEKGRAVIKDILSDTTVSPQSDLLIGADGAYSTLRGALQTTPRFNYCQQYIEHGYKELRIPPVDGDFTLDPHALHIWPRGGYMLIALPNTDKSFTCTLFLPYKGEYSFAALTGETDVIRFFEKQFPDALSLMPELINDFFSNPTADLVTIRCDPWSRYGKNLLIGDAAHAIVPFYGQGMNAAFEDCRIFSEMMKEVRR